MSKPQYIAPQYTVIDGQHIALEYHQAIGLHQWRKVILLVQTPVELAEAFEQFIEKRTPKEPRSLAVHRLMRIVKSMCLDGGKPTARKGGPVPTYEQAQRVFTAMLAWEDRIRSSVLGFERVPLNWEYVPSSTWAPKEARTETLKPWVNWFFGVRAGFMVNDIITDDNGESIADSEFSEAAKSEDTLTEVLWANLTKGNR